MVYLSRQDPNHDESADYIDTRYVERITFINGTLFYEVISAS